MSRKRFKKQPPSKRPPANAPESQDSDAVPDEILAEGSGPQEALGAADLNQRAELESVAAEMAEKLVADLGADAADLSVSVEASDESSEPKRGKKSRKSRGAKDAAGATSDDDTAAGELSADEATDGEAAAMSAETSIAADEQSADAASTSKPKRSKRGKRSVATDADVSADGSGDSDTNDDAELSADGETSVEDAVSASDSSEFDNDTLSAATSTDGEHAESSGSVIEVIEMVGGEIVEISVEGEEGEGAELPTGAGSMDRKTVKQLIEALVFAADKPVTVQRLRQLTRIADTKMIETMLVEIQGEYEPRGLVLTCVSGGWQFRTRPQFSAWVQQLIAGRPVRLSRAQLETLAIVAYRQPITRPEIDDIRGVDSSATLKLLMDRQLIRILGKKEEAGRPMLYGTTKEFLDFFSLGDLRELPTLREYSELTDESRKVVSDRLGVPLDAISSGSGGDDGGNSGSGSGGEGGSGDGGGFDPFGGEGGSEPGDSGDMPSSAHAMNADESSIEASESSESSLEAGSDESNETAVEASSDESNEGSLEASSDESSESSPEASSDASVEASSDESNETSIEATSDESSEGSLEASSDESSESSLEASSDASVEASSDESNGEIREMASGESDETAVEASSDESNEGSLEASSDESNETSIEATSDESSKRSLEASSDESSGEIREMASDSTDEKFLASSETSETWVEANSDESDSLSALASRVLARSDEHDESESGDSLDATFAAGHVRAHANAETHAAPSDDDELASGSQAFAAVSEADVQAILAEGSDGVLSEGLDVESMVGAMASSEDAAADDATDGTRGGMVASNELVSTDDIVDDLPEPTE